jgi:hypothetical protein
MMANESWEACQLWIEQEVEVGLDKGEALRAIGRRISEEVKKYFDADVTPDAIRMKAGRMKSQNIEITEESEGGTNVPRGPSRHNFRRITAEEGRPLCSICKKNYVAKRDGKFRPTCGTCRRFASRLNKLKNGYSPDSDMTQDDWKKVLTLLLQVVEFLKCKRIDRNDRLRVDSLIGIINTWYKTNLNGGKAND